MLTAEKRRKQLAPSAFEAGRLRLGRLRDNRVTGFEKARTEDAVPRDAMGTTEVDYAAVAHLHRKGVSDTDRILAHRDGQVNVSVAVRGDQGVRRGVHAVSPDVLRALLHVGDLSRLNEAHVFDLARLAVENGVRIAVLLRRDPRAILADGLGLMRVDKADVVRACELRSLVRGERLNHIADQVHVVGVAGNEARTRGPAIRPLDVRAGEQRRADEAITILGIVIAEQRGRILQQVGDGSAEQGFGEAERLALFTNRDGQRGRRDRVRVHIRVLSESGIARESTVLQELDRLTRKGRQIGLLLSNLLKTKNRLRLKKNLVRVNVENDIGELDASAGGAGNRVGIESHDSMSY